MNNPQLSQADLINAFCDVLGVTRDERDRLTNSRDTPSDVELDLAAVRMKLLAGLDLSAIPSKTGVGDASKEVS